METTSASVFFLVFFLALHTDRVKERTVMVMPWTRTLLSVFFGPEPWWLWLGWQRCQCEFSCSLVELQRRGEKESWEEQEEDGDGVWRLVSRTRALKTRSSLGQWRKEVRLSRSSLVRKSRSSVAIWEMKWTRIGCSKPREKIQEIKALQKTTLQTSYSTSSERKYHPHSLGITWRQWTWRSTSAQSWTSYTAVLNILSGFWQ